MSSKICNHDLRGTRSGVAVLCAVLVNVWLAACSGTTGSSGAPGAVGAAGPAGPVGATTGAATLNVSTATSITGKVNSVTIGSPPVVKFQLADQNGAPLKGLAAGNLGFIIAKLVPGQNGSGSHWVSYIYSSNAPGACPGGVAACATTAQIEANVESATLGTFVDNGDGTYVYTFKQDITKDPKVVYEPTLTHRVAFEIRGLAQANNGVYTFQPSTGATTGLFSREIVDTATCDSCHTSLSAHGGARVEVQYCVMCHNPSSTEPSSGNSLDMQVMIHKLHAGSSLPSINDYATGTTNTTPILGQGYWIVGYGQSLNNFNTVVYPQDVRNCVSCHSQTHATLTEAANFKTVPTIAACGACHDNINFATGLNHSAANLIADNTQCATCHGPTSTINNGTLHVVERHVVPERAFQATLAYNIIKATNTAPGLFPIIQFSVTDPSNGNAPHNVLTEDPFLHCADTEAANPNLSIAIAWSTTDYTNVGSGVSSEVAQPINVPVVCGTPPTAVGDGSFTITSATAIPTTAKGSAGFLFQGHLVHDFNDTRGLQEIPVPNVVAYAPVTDAAADARREVTPVAKCDVCHDQLNGHGGNRLDSVQSCSFCHNPNATDVIARQGSKPNSPPTVIDPGDSLAEQTIDLKVMIHAIHASVFRASGSTIPYIAYHRSNPSNFGMTRYSGVVNDCLACHAPDTYYPPDPTSSTVLATTVSTYSVATTAAPSTWLGLAAPTGQTAVTAGTAVCSSCHLGATAAAHMTQNGGSFTAIKDASSAVKSQETCVLCHGPGGVADVKVVHNLAAYQ